MKFLGTVGNGPTNKWLNFGGDPDHRLETGIVFRIHHYWEIRKMVSTDCIVRSCSAGGRAILVDGSEGFNPPLLHITADTRAYGFKCFEGVHYVAFRERFLQ